MAKAEAYSFCAYASREENEPLWLDTVISKSGDVHNTELPAVYTTGTGHIASDSLTKMHTASSKKAHMSTMVSDEELLDPAVMA